ncbi:MAG: hypothetical protein K8H88_07220, partial [Sandaracinaceae bacterium]|nr:hypothetical protein [Sandaracinaceae bacterium]
SITVGSGAPPAMVPPEGYGTSVLWAVARDTGVRHRLGHLRYTSSVTGGYRLGTGDGTYSVRLVPGAYDILYERDATTSSSGSDDRWVYDVTSSSPLPNGWRVLQENVTVAPGTTTLHIDVPSSALTANLTVDGAPPPAMVPPEGYGTSVLWAVSRDTGVRHRLGHLRHTSSVTGGYRLGTGDGVFSVRLVPGVYDVLYERDATTSSSGSNDRWVYDVTSSSPMPNGWRVLRQCVVFP